MIIAIIYARQADDAGANDRVDKVEGRRGHAAGHNYTGHEYMGHDYTGHIYIALNHTGHNYMGHDYTGHNYVGHNYIGHNNAGRNYPGHNYTGHNNIGRSYLGYNYAVELTKLKVAVGMLRACRHVHIHPYIGMPTDWRSV